MAAVVRSAQPEEADAIGSLMRDVIGSAVDTSLRREILDNVQANLAVWLRRPHECLHLVAVDGDSIVGVVLVKDFWNLCSLFVARPVQGRGMGRALMQAAIAACRGRSPKNALHLNAHPNAVRFYERLGFRTRPSVQDSTSGIRAMAYSFESAAARPRAP